MELAVLFLPLSLLFVGAVLVLNGLWMLGHISDREIPVINFAVAAITSIVALLILLNADDPADVSAAAFTLLFSMTYAWVGINRFTDTDGKGLGWFSLFVSLTVLPKGIIDVANALTFMDVWLGLSWIAWSGLWFMYFLTLALQKNITTMTACATLAAGVITAWAPAMSIIYVGLA